MDVAKIKFKQTWSIEATLDQHKALTKQHVLMAEIGRIRMKVLEGQNSRQMAASS